MKLFKKSNKEINEDIEIVDFDNNITNTLEERKEFKIAIFIGILVLVFALLLPTFTSIFSKSSIFSYSNSVNEVVNKDTIDGMLEINKEKGYITIKKIKFYNPRKSTDNNLVVTYLPEGSEKDVDSLNIYIEIYNSNKELIARNKFTNISNLERKVQGNYKIELNEVLYRESKYFKVVIIKDDEFNNINDILKCNYTFNEGNIKVNYERVYNFTKSGLISYKVTKSISKIDVNNLDNTVVDKYINLFNTENNILSKTNIKDVINTSDKLEYLVNLSELELNKSEYKKIYEMGSIKRQIELNEEKMNWMCE